MPTKLIIPQNLPKGDDGYRIFSVRLKEEILEKIDDLAQQTDNSRNEVMRMLVEYALDQAEAEAKVEIADEYHTQTEG